MMRARTLPSQTSQTSQPARAALALILTLLICWLAILPRLASAQGPGLPAADEKAISTYVLDRKIFDKLVAFKQEADELQDSDEEDADPAAAPKSLDDMVRVIEKEPKAVALLKKHGLASRDYLIAYLALIRAGFADAMKATTPSQLAEGGTNAANLAFYRANKAEADKLFQSVGDDPPIEEDDTPDGK